MSKTKTILVTGISCLAIGYAANNAINEYKAAPALYSSTPTAIEHTRELGLRTEHSSNKYRNEVENHRSLIRRHAVILSTPSNKEVSVPSASSETKKQNCQLYIWPSKYVCSDGSIIDTSQQQAPSQAVQQRPQGQVQPQQQPNYQGQPQNYQQQIPAPVIIQPPVPTYNYYYPSYGYVQTPCTLIINSVCQQTIYGGGGPFGYGGGYGLGYGVYNGIRNILRH